MPHAYPSDEELFPHLKLGDYNADSKCLREYREAVVSALDEKMIAEIKDVEKAGKDGRKSSVNPFRKGFPIWKYKSTWKATAAEKAVQAAILNGSIDAFPKLTDLWISNGAVETMYVYSVAADYCYQAVVEKGGRRVGPGFPGYPSCITATREPNVYRYDFAYEFLESDVTGGVFTPFYTAQRWLSAKKKKTELDKIGCSPPLLILFILLTALMGFLSSHSHRFIHGLAGILCFVFGVLSVIGVILTLADRLPDRKKGEGGAEFDFSKEEEAEIKANMEANRLAAYTMLRYFTLWKKHLRVYPGQYPKLPDCDGKDVLPRCLEDLDKKIKTMEELLRICDSFPSLEGVK